MKIIYIKLFFGVLFLGTPFLSEAQLQTTGFIRNYNAVLTQPEHELITARNRLRLNLGRSFSVGEIQVSNDIINHYSESADSISYRLREAYADLYFPTSDLRIGKQIISWGRTEGTFITDILTPVDLSEFLTQDFADLRMGITALKYTRYFGSNYLQLVINPVFNPNNLLKYQDRWFPTLPISTSLPITIQQSSPENTLRNVQLAGRYSFRSNLNYDLDVGLLYWHHPSPRYRKELTLNLQNGGQLQLTEQYTQSMIGMYSTSVQLMDKLLLTSESAYYHSRSFDYLPNDLRTIDLENPSLSELIQIAQAFGQNEDGFLIKRPWLISMISLQYSLWEMTINGQFINEHIFNYDPTILQEENFYYATLSLRRSFFRDTFQLLAFSRYNFVGEDFWLNSELTYTEIDNFEAAAGIQLFGGKNPRDFYGHLSFDTYEQNSFAYLKVSAYF